MPNRSKEKGDRAETQVMYALQQIEGVEAQRVGLPLQAGKSVRGDVIADFAGRRMTFEVKSRSGNTGFSTLVKWVAGVDALALKVEGDTRPLIVLPWQVFQTLVEESIAFKNLQEVDKKTVSKTIVTSAEAGEWNPNTNQYDNCYHEGHGD